VKVHEFRSSGAAYDACQYREDLEKPGELLHVPGERVVGLSWTWPIAVTEAAGELHQLNPGATIPEELPAAGCRAAAHFAHQRGYPLAPQFNAFLVREAMA
jgi:hypothetical protein